MDGRGVVVDPIDEWRTISPVEGRTQQPKANERTCQAEDETKSEWKNGSRITPE